MIESIDNGIQLIITALCTGIAAYEWIRNNCREWVLLGLFTGIYFLGDLYWQLYLVFYHKTPIYSDIPYVSWYASYIFLLLLLLMRERVSAISSIRRFWPVLIFTVGMCIFFMQYGSYVSNIAAMVFMSLLICSCLEGLLDNGEADAEKTGEGWKPLYGFVLLFCLLEYGLWAVSCFFSGNSISNPYYWVDLLLSVSFLLLTFATKKAVAYGLY